MAARRSSTLAAVQALVRSVAFRSQSENPATVQRTIRFYLSDGDGAAAVARTVLLNVHRHNDAPALGLGGTAGYTHDQPAIVLALNASVRDVDSPNFEFGRLRVWVEFGASAANRLAIGGPFTVDAQGNVLRGDLIIGQRVSSGFGVSELVIVFNANANPSVAQQLVRAITFKTVGGTAGERQVSFTLSDGKGGISAKVFKTVNVI